MKKHTIRIAALGFVLAGAIFSSCVSDNNKADESKEVAEEINDKKFDTKANEKDAQFVVDASSGSYDEISIADVALSKSSNADIKLLAQSLKDDHSAFITELNGLASKKSITVPAVASEDGGKAVTKLSEAKVTDFDKDWLEKEKDMHEKSVKKYEDASNNCTDADIKNWATTTLPKIKNHLEMINKATGKKK
jgi:putative membrane protein